LLLKFAGSFILVFTVGAAAQASEVIQFYQPKTPANPVIAVTGPVAQPPPAQVTVEDEGNNTIIVPAPQPQPRPRVSPGVTNFQQYMPSQTNTTNTNTSNVSTGDVTYDDGNSGDDGNSSEVVNTEPPPIPATRPPNLYTQNPPPNNNQNPPPRTSLYDISNCTYHALGGRACWPNRTAGEIKTIMKKIIANVAVINGLHKTQVDPRYLLCSGYRESRFDPGVRGSQGERGMFQVMKETAVTSLKQGPMIPEFKNYRNQPETYLTRMANSSLAQTELAYLVLTVKAKDLGTATYNDIFLGRGSVERYRQMAVRYNGGGTQAQAYGNAVSNCLRCMRAPDGMPDYTKDFNYTSVDGCLAMATK